MLSAMIVEDELLSRIGIKSVIDWQAAGIDAVFEASNGLDAYEIYKKEKPNIVITDLKMPEMDGIALIRAIRTDSRDTATRIIVLSCKEEFPLVQQALNLGVSHYFLKVTMKCDELQSVLCTLSGEVAHKTLKGSELELSAEYMHELVRACLKGNPGHYDTASILRGLGFNENREYTCAILRLINANASNASSIPNTKILLQILRRSINDSIKVEVVYLDWDEYVVMMQVDKAEELKSIFDGWCTDLNMYANISVLIGYCNACAKGDLSKAMANASRALMRCFFSGDSTYYTSTACDTNRLPDTTYQILSSLPDRYIHVPAVFINEYTVKVKQLTEKEYSTPTSFKETLCGLMVWVATQAESECVSIEQVSIDYTCQLMACNTLAESLAVFRKFASSVFETSSFSKNTPAIILTVLSYIYNNLGKPMSLQEISRHVHLNASYLSTLFKKVMHRNLIDYINACRIKRAEILLQETDCSITQISQSVGFSEEIYFYRLFRRFSGITPGEYRYQQQNAK